MRRDTVHRVRNVAVLRDWAREVAPHALLLDVVDVREGDLFLNDSSQGKLRYDVLSQVIRFDFRGDWPQRI